MRFFILLGDGMADLPIRDLNGRTPLEVAKKLHMDTLCATSVCGMVQTIPDGMEPGSGPANMSVMGFDPNQYYTGRAPLEALSMGLNLGDDDLVFRCNLVSLSPDSNTFDMRRMLDYSSGEITSKEAAELIAAVNTRFATDDLTFFAGKSYRHLAVLHRGSPNMKLTPPHDISGKVIRDYLPQGETADRWLSMMRESVDLFSQHPVNVKRRQKGFLTADCLWPWGLGKRTVLPDFYKRYQRRGAVISAVDLLFGLARGSGLQTIEVPGATGTLHTNYKGKADAAIKAFEDGYDYVYLHVEAPDECGHQGDMKGKIQAIESIDKKILGPVNHYLDQTQKAYKILVMPDHPTPLKTRTHSRDPVPFFLFDSRDKTTKGPDAYCEKKAATTGTFYKSGPALFAAFINDTAPN